jgi:malate dehydrogenase
MVVNGEVIIVKGVDMNEFSMQKLSLTEAELLDERDAIKDLFPVGDV